MVNVELLKAEIDDVGIPMVRLAEKCHLTRQGLDKKLKNPKTITANDAYYLASALRITDTDKLMSIFFAEKVE